MSHTKIVADVKRGIFKACMENGIKDVNEILTVTAQAINGMGKMSGPAYKAWATMDERTLQNVKNRLSRINRRKIR